MTLGNRPWLTLFAYLSVLIGFVATLLGLFAPVSSPEFFVPCFIFGAMTVFGGAGIFGWLLTEDNRIRAEKMADLQKKKD